MAFAAGMSIGLEPGPLIGVQSGLWRSFGGAGLLTVRRFSKGINAMQQAFRASALVPRGFVVDDATSDDAGALIVDRRGIGTPAGG